jgi:hypothetical protein
MRLYGVQPDDVVDAIADDAGWISLDQRGNIVATGSTGGRLLTVVLARDELDLVITVYGARRRRR